ncbi:MAG: hypothetical protein GY906_15860 [bacterium]|nr:hypothetical protein [bacterium]
MSKVRQITDEYRLLGVLSTAPQSTVFKAAHPETGEFVTIKLINPLGPVATAASRKRFEENMKLLQKVAIPQIPPLHDFGFTPDENAFMVTGLIEGEGVHATGAQDLGERCAMLADIGRALSTLAKKKVFHNNISPANILIPTADDGPAAVVTGLGTASFLTPGERVELLTLAPDCRRYAPPEVRVGDIEDGAEAAQDSYGYAVLICDLLGLSVEGLGRPNSEIAIPAPVVGAWKDVQTLAKVLVTALDANPKSRKVAFDRLAKLLMAGAKKLQGVGGIDLGSPAAEAEIGVQSTDSASVDAASASGSAPAPARRQDPHKTNPALDADSFEEATPQPQEAPPAAPPPLPPDPVVAPSPQPVPKTQVIQQPSPQALPDIEPEVAPAPQPAPPSPKSKAPLPKWAIPAAGAAAIIVVSIVVALIVTPLVTQRRSAQATPSPVPMPTRVPITTATTGPESIHLRLEEAELAVQNEDVAAARVALEDLTALEVASFTATERLLHEQLQRAVEGIDFRQAVDELRQGMKRGDIPMVQRAVASLSEADQDELNSEPSIGREIEKARRVMRAYTMLQRAQRSGDAFQVIGRADAMTAVLPGYRRAAQLKTDATARILGQAEAAISARRFSDAIETLEALEKAWPGREGVQERIELCRVRLRETQQTQQALSQVKDLDQSGRPDEAIAMLDRLSIGEQFAGQATSLREAAQRHLNDIDAETPVLKLPEDIKLTFRKKDTLPIPITVTDDFKVVEVRLMIRTEDETNYRDAPLTREGGNRWVLSLGPNLHLSKNVYFYAIAKDISGNIGWLASASQPVEVKKKKWFQP